LPAAVGITTGLSLRGFTTHGYLRGLSTPIEFLRLPRSATALATALVESGQIAETESNEATSRELSPEEMARQTLHTLNLAGTELAFSGRYEGMIREMAQVRSPDLAWGKSWAMAVVATDSEGKLSGSAAACMKLTRLFALAQQLKTILIMFAPSDETAQRRALGQIDGRFAGSVIVVTTLPTGQVLARNRALAEIWGEAEQTIPQVIVGEPWTENAVVALNKRVEAAGRCVLRVCRAVRQDEGSIALETARAEGHVRTRTISNADAGPCFTTVTSEAEIEAASEGAQVLERVWRWSASLDRRYGKETMRDMLSEVEEEIRPVKLSEAEFIVDVGFGIGNRDGFEAVIEPLIKALRRLGVPGIMVGGSRKVTEELHLLPPDRQIGQSGVSVNPRVLLAIGISGAPQHLNYIGPRATIVAFNQDPEAPLMVLNRTQARPRVFRVVGDLFETVPAFTEALSGGMADNMGHEKVESPHRAQVAAGHLDMT
jgi:electron transfer flavoprotein alpha subunit